MHKNTFQIASDPNLTFFIFSVPYTEGWPQREKSGFQRPRTHDSRVLWARLSG